MPGETGGIPTAQGRMQWTLSHGDHLHFAVHMIAGRVLDVCPCTRRAASVQYWRASYHVATPIEAALVLNARPSSLQGWIVYAVAPVAVVAEWVGKGVAWLGGDRPLHVTYVSIGPDGFVPSELHVASGATVIWRNDDEDTRSVASQDGQWASGELEPSETYSVMFPRRGRYEFVAPDQVEAGFSDPANGYIVVD
jgi:plastocyanin